MFVEDIKNFAGDRAVVLYGITDNTTTILRILKFNNIDVKYIVTMKKKPPAELLGVAVRGSFDTAPPAVYCVFSTRNNVKTLLRKYELKSNFTPTAANAANTANHSNSADSAKIAGAATTENDITRLAGIQHILLQSGKHDGNSRPGRDYTVVDRDYTKYDYETDGVFIGKYTTGIREHTDEISAGRIKSFGRYTSVEPTAVFGYEDNSDGRLTLCAELLRELSGKNSPRDRRGNGDNGVAVGNDVHIGANCFINTATVKYIGDGAVIAANSVVTCDVRPYAVMNGNPAKAEKFRFHRREIEQLEHIRWWDFDEEKLAANADCFADYHLLLERFG